MCMFFSGPKNKAVTYHKCLSDKQGDSSSTAPFRVGRFDKNICFVLLNVSKHIMNIEHDVQ